MKDKLLLSFVLAVGLSLGACDATRFGATTEDPDPGDGAVKCPGNKACPNQAFTGRAFGVAGFEPGRAADGRPLQLICTGDGATSDAGCPSGYVGRLLLKDSLPQREVTVCRQGKAPCGTVEGRKTWAIVCADGARGCPMLPKRKD